MIRLQRRWRWVAVGITCVIALCLGMSGWTGGAERMLRQLEWRLAPQRAEDGIVIVEIDARSIAAIDRWPWPRHHYVAAIDRLRRAGAAAIAFDVDFSSPSTAAEDDALAGALTRAAGLAILPTLGQTAGGGQQGWIESLPIPALRNQATLAAVSILPDEDGTVRRAPVGVMIGGAPRPSLSVAMAGRSGQVGADFPVDYAIDPASVARLSFVDVRDGRFDPRAVRGKTLLIGATAVELGDRYAVPNHGVIPGVVIQALAAETLRHGFPREFGWIVPLLIAIAATAPILWLRRRGAVAALAAGVPLVLIGGATALGAAGWWFDVAPALAATVLLTLAAAAASFARGVQHRRLHDPETGLPNRRALADIVAGVPVGVATASIGDYDKLLVSLGPAGATELVARLHDRIGLVAEGAPICRVEDRLLAWTVSDPAVVADRFEALRAAMLSPVEIAGRRIDVTLALGFAAAGDDASRTIANAAMAAAQALASDHGWHVHAADEELTLDRDLSLLGELDEAIAAGEITVLYQPKLALAEGRIASVEALVRWNHPRRGFLSPDLFIPLAERSNRIDALTLYVARRTIADLQTWHAAGYPISAAINLSAKLLTATAFADDLHALIAQAGCAPDRITLEVTESAALSDPEIAKRTLDSFAAIGVHISMDDYGTGQSTLSYIKQLPLSELKIDRSFVQHAHRSRGDAVLVRSTVDLAHELGLRVVAEGVEDAECLAFLRTIGCDFAQGYYVSRPVAADALLRLLAAPTAIAA